MIGFLFLIVIVGWLIAAIFLSKRIPHWMGIAKHATAVSLLLFPLLLTAPIADELIGRWQFNRLCEREAVVTLSPDWERVKRAKRVDSPPRYFNGYLVPVDSQGGTYFDIDSGKVFMTSQSLFTDGGFLRRHFYGLNGQATSCHPKNLQAIQTQLNLFELLKQGK